MKIPKVEIKRILYATDLSPSANHAFGYAVSLANLYKASITFLYVLFDDPGREARIESLIGEEKWSEIQKRHYQDAREQLIGKKRDGVAIKEVLHHFSEKVKGASEGYNFATDEIMVEKGHPAEEILKAADSRDCDLIVMGSHGVGGIVKMLLGSTASDVLHKATKPVLVVRVSEEE